MGGSSGGDECGSGAQASCVGPHASSTGTMVDQSGKPVAGVTIFFQPSAKSLDFASHAVSDAAGHYEDTVVPIGDVTISVDSAHRIVEGPTSLSASDGQKLTVNLTVAPAS
jgi:hypothetical protein